MKSKFVFLSPLTINTNVMENVLNSTSLRQVLQNTQSKCWCSHCRNIVTRQESFVIFWLKGMLSHCSPRSRYARKQWVQWIPHLDDDGYLSRYKLNLTGSHQTLSLVFRFQSVVLLLESLNLFHQWFIYWILFYDSFHFILLQKMQTLAPLK